MRYFVGFGLIAAALAGLFFLFIDRTTEWSPYAVWLIALSGATVIIYGLDKLLSKAGRLRCPESLLSLLALLGGFPGGWAGMLLFRHKSNFRKHPTIWLFLTLATVGHVALAYYWFVAR